MSEDDILGGAGIEGLLQTARDMQRRIENAQSRAATETVTGESGGGLVKVTMTGAMQVTRVQIDPAVAGAEDLPMLEDLVAAATNQAVKRAQDLMAQEIGPLAGMLDAAGLKR